MANSGTPKAVLSKGGVDHPNNGGNLQHLRLLALFSNHLSWLTNTSVASEKENG